MIRARRWCSREARARLDARGTGPVEPDGNVDRRAEHIDYRVCQVAKKVPIAMSIIADWWRGRVALPMTASVNGNVVFRRFQSYENGAKKKKLESRRVPWTKRLTTEGLP